MQKNRWKFAGLYDTITIKNPIKKGERFMKQVLTIIGIIVAAAAVAVAVLRYLPAPATIREDFICED